MAKPDPKKFNRRNPDKRPLKINDRERIWQHSCGSYTFILLADGQVACSECKEFLDLFEWFDGERIQ